MPPAEHRPAGIVVGDDSVGEAMQAKLACAQAALRAIVRADCTAVEVNALRLYEISETAAWTAHDTVSYHVLSDRFREIVSTMAEHARAGDIEAVTADYQVMTENCLACHTYLRQERLIGDFPDITSRVPDSKRDGLGDLAAALGF